MFYTPHYSTYETLSVAKLKEELSNYLKRREKKVPSESKNRISYSTCKKMYIILVYPWSFFTDSQENEICIEEPN